MTAEEQFLSLEEKIPQAKLSKMFGARCYKMPNGKATSVFYKDDLVVKLSGTDVQEVLKLKGAKLFEPMEGRPMNGWYQIPFAHKKLWEKFALISAGEVARLPANKKK